MKKGLIILLVFSAFSMQVFAETTEIYSGFVKEFDEFAADGINYKAVPSGEENSVVLQSDIGTVVVYNGTNCVYMSKYQYCMSDYKYSLGGKTRLNGKDPEEYLLKVSSTYKDAELSITYRMADKNDLFVGESVKVKARIKNIGDSVAKEVRYVETFPDDAYTSSQQDINYRKLEWSGSLASANEKDFEYTVYFASNGTYTIPLVLSYMSVNDAKKIENALTFNVIKEYYTNIDASEVYETGQIARVDINLSGNAKDIVNSEFFLPEGFAFINTSFERHFGVNSWEGNVSSNPGFFIEFTSEKDLEKEIYLLTNYIGSNNKLKTGKKIRFSHEPPRIDYMIKDGKISFFVKNNNNHSIMSDLSINLHGGYSKFLKIPSLNPKENMLVFSEKLSQPIGGDIRGSMQYVLNAHEYVNNFNLSEEEAGFSIVTAGSNPTTPAADAEDETVLESEDAANIASSDAAAVIDPVEADNRNFVEKFFDWLSSIF